MASAFTQREFLALDTSEEEYEEEECEKEVITLNRELLKKEFFSWTRMEVDVTEDDNRNEEMYLLSAAAKSTPFYCCTCLTPSAQLHDRDRLDKSFNARQSLILLYGIRRDITLSRRVPVCWIVHGFTPYVAVKLLKHDSSTKIEPNAYPYGYLRDLKSTFEGWIGAAKEYRVPGNLLEVLEIDKNGIDFLFMVKLVFSDWTSARSAYKLFKQMALKKTFSWGEFQLSTCSKYEWNPVNDFLRSYNLKPCSWIAHKKDLGSRCKEHQSSYYVHYRDLFASSHSPSASEYDCIPLRILSFDLECRTAKPKPKFDLANCRNVVQIAIVLLEILFDTRSGHCDIKRDEKVVLTIGNMEHGIPNAKILQFFKKLKSTNRDTLTVELEAQEAGILDAFRFIVQTVDPEIIAGHYHSHFDLDYLKTRAKCLQSRFKISPCLTDLGRNRELGRLTFSSRKLPLSKSTETWARTYNNIRGRIILDAFNLAKLFKKNHANCSLHSLSVSNLPPSYWKIEVDVTDIDYYIFGECARLRLLARYCLLDAEIPMQLLLTCSLEDFPCSAPNNLLFLIFDKARKNGTLPQYVANKKVE